jgi:hypothetical protein
VYAPRPEGMGPPGKEKTMNKALRKCSPALFALAVASMVAGCPSINLLAPDYENYTVVLEPNESPPGTWTLEVLTGPQGWNANSGGPVSECEDNSPGNKGDPVKQPGYVGFAPEKFGSVTLSLNQRPQNNKCTDDLTTSADWVITKIALSKNGNKCTQKGKNFGSNQRGWLTSAFPQADDDGIVLNVPKSEGVVSFTVGNRNNHRGRQWAYYQVTATRCSDGETAVTDPGWQNGGNH